MLNIELLKSVSACCSFSAPARRCLHLRPRSIFSSPRASPPFRHIVQLGDPVLRAECEPVPPAEIKTKEVQEVIRNLVPCLGILIFLIIAQARRGLCMITTLGALSKILSYNQRVSPFY